MGKRHPREEKEERGGDFLHYVIGDVHGCMDEMMLLLKRIERQDPEAKFIFVGDFVDRGPKVYETLIWAMKNITPDGKYQSVLGNHEDMCADWIREYLKWLDRKDGTGYPTYHYDFDDLMMRKHGNSRWIIPKEKLLPYLLFFESLPLNKKITVTTKWGKEVTFRIAHAWHMEKVTEKRKRESNLWDRRTHYNSDKEILIHGHTPTLLPEYYLCMEDNTQIGRIGYRHMNINVDGGCVFWNLIGDVPASLCGICLETFEEFYPRSVLAQIKKQTKGTAYEDYQEIYARYQRKTPKIMPYREEMLKFMGK